MTKVLFFILIFPITAFSQEIYPYYYFNSSQLINKHGKYVIPKQALDTIHFTEGFAAIKMDAKTGFANLKGVMVIEPKYDTVIHFWQNGLAVMGIKKEGRLETGGINREGTEVIPFKYTSIEEGQKDIWAARNANGAISLYLTSGILLAENIESYSTNPTGYITIEKNRRWGVINKKGELLIPIKYKHIQEEFPDEFMAIPFPVWQAKDAQNTTLASFECDSLASVAPKLFRYEVNKKSGVVTMEGKELLAPVYDRIDTTIGLLLLQNEGRLGMADFSGKIVLPVAYDSIFTDKTGFVRGKLGGYWGVYDSKGKELLPPAYSGLNVPSENMVAAKNKQGLWGYVAFSGDTVLPFKYTYAGSFKNDSATVGIKGKLVVINKTGRVLVPAQYYPQYQFGLYHKEDTVNCYVYPPYLHYRFSQAGKGYVYVKQGKETGVINKAGKLIVPIVYDSVFAPSADTVFLVTKDFKIGTYDKYGNVLSTPNEKLQQVFPLHDNRARMLKKDRYGYIDKMGNVRISPQYANAMDFSENRAAVVITGRWAFIDENENIIAQPYYSDVYSFVNGAGRVKQNGKWNFVNKSGKEVNSSWYDEIVPTAYGKWYLYNKKRMGIADSSGLELIVPRYEQIEDFGNGYYKVKRENRIGVLNNKADFIIPFEYDDACFDTINKFFLVVTKGKEEIVRIGVKAKK